MPDFLPQGHITGIGSLPYRHPVDGVRFVAEHSPTLPFWVQLPARSPDEMMIPQMLSPLRDLLDPDVALWYIRPAQIDEFRRRLREAEAIFDPNSTAGFFAFERACEGNRFPQAVALKGQMTGVFTLAYSLYLAEGEPLASVPDIYAELVDYVIRLGKWQIERLQRFGKPVLIFIDEPMLYPMYRALKNEIIFAGLTRLVAALRATGAVVGIHDCGCSEPHLLCRAGADIISFDAHQYLEAYLSSDVTRDFVAQGGMLAFGMVPTHPDLSAFDTEPVFDRWLSAAATRFDVPRLVSQSLITATCGLAFLPTDSARASFDKCHQLSGLFQHAAG